jgi:N utilization substance protein B
VVTFPTIPVKVTMNEYVEISKYYGTPKSRSFVNGLLDKLVAKLDEEGLIRKEGKGLL